MCQKGFDYSMLLKQFSM